MDIIIFVQSCKIVDTSENISPLKVVYKNWIHTIDNHTQKKVRLVGQNDNVCATFREQFYVLTFELKCVVVP
jgi:hypothetical protein